MQPKSSKTKITQLEHAVLWGLRFRGFICKIPSEISLTGRGRLVHADGDVYNGEWRTTWLTATVFTTILMELSKKVGDSKTNNVVNEKSDHGLANAVIHNFLKSSVTLLKFNLSPFFQVAKMGSYFSFYFKIIQTLRD